MNGYRNRVTWVTADGATVEGTAEQAGILAQKVGVSVSGSVQVQGLVILAALLALLALTNGLASAIGG
jgi:hypothetical protein